MSAGMPTTVNKPSAARLDREDSPLRQADLPLGTAPALHRGISDVKGQLQFLLYVADQLEEAAGQLGEPADRSQAAFLRKVLAMYSSQLESRHQGLGERIAEVCQELYIAIREFEG
jgi:hypothetical protein